MSSEDNLIRFPGTKKESKQTQKESKLKEKNGTVASVRENVIYFSGSSEVGTTSVKKSRKYDVQKKNRGVSFASSGDREEGKEFLQEENRRGYNYAFAAVACSLFLMLVSFPFLNQYKQSSQLRGIASEEQRSQEKTVLNLIHTGQRKLASIGRKPAVKDIFSVELLRSRYDIRWHNGKLVYAVLLENKEPLALPDTHKIVNRYSSLFPSHSSIRKLDSVSGDLEVYELKDSEGLNTAQVESLKDVEGRLLSIHVSW